MKITTWKDLESLDMTKHFKVSLTHSDYERVNFTEEEQERFTHLTRNGASVTEILAALTLMAWKLENNLVQLPS